MGGGGYPPYDWEMRLVRNNTADTVIPDEPQPSSKNDR